jgi:hypothetical protein
MMIMLFAYFLHGRGNKLRPEKIQATICIYHLRKYSCKEKNSKTLLK